MQKYIFGSFTASTKTTRDGRFNRRITLLYDDDRFAIINRKISDAYLRDQKELMGFWSVDEVRKDKRGHDFLICSPVYIFDKGTVSFAEEVWSYVIDIAHAMTQPISEDTDCDNRMDATAIDMLRRMLHHTDITEDIQAGRDKLFAKLVEGEFDFCKLFEFATTPVYSQPQTAKLVPLYYLKIGRQHQEGIVFMDENNFDMDGSVIRVNDWNLSKWENCIPKCLQIHSANGRLYLDIDPSMFDFKLPDHGFCNYGGDYQFADRHFIAIPKNGEKPMEVYFSSDDTASKIYDDIMEKIGLTRKNGQYVPNNMPDWYIMEKKPYTTEECKPNETVLARFENGMDGYYPLVYLIRRYPGKCKNGDFTVKGITAESLKIEIRTY